MGIRSRAAWLCCGLLPLALAAGCRSAAPRSALEPESVPARTPEPEPEPKPADDSYERTGELSFAGCDAIEPKELEEALGDEIRRLHERGFRKSDIDDLSFDVAGIYRRRGHHFVETTYTYQPGRAVITIAEGPRVTIENVAASGNLAISDGRLEDSLSAQRTALGLGSRIFVQNAVDALPTAIEELYAERGYLQARVADPVVTFSDDRSRARISIEIEEGLQSVVAGIDISEVQGIDRAELKEKLAYLEGSAFAPHLDLEVRSLVLEAYSDLGHPDAEVSVTDAAEDAGLGAQVAVRLAVSGRPGPLVRIRKVIVDGNERTHTAFIASRILFEEGDVYSGTLARRSFQRLQRSGLFRTIDLRLVPASPPDAGPVEEGQWRDIIVDVVEGPSLEYFFEMGYGSYDLIRARAGVRERNLFGRALIGRAEILGSLRGGQATVGVSDPWFLGSEWTADLPLTLLYREEPSFTELEAKASLRLSREITEDLTGGGSYRFGVSRVDELEVSDTGDEDENLVLGAAGPFLELDTRDDLFLPTRGMRLRTFGEVGAPELGGEISFLHGGISVTQQLTLFEGTTLAGTMQTEWIVPFDDTDAIPIQERLFNGGENSVRSFQESQLGPKDANGEATGGEVRNVVSLELRQRVWAELHLAIFADYGNIAPSAEKPLEDFRPGVGFGLRYNLFIGPVRLDFGFNPDQRDDEDLFAFHFAVGLPF